MYFDPAIYRLNPLYSLLNWAVVAGALTFVVMFVSLLNLVLTRGSKGFGIFFGELGAMLSDLIHLSPRRIWALTRLTFMEAYRRKALAVFVVFGLLFMFAGWFMGDSKEIKPDQVKVYISFVLTALSWLTLPVVLLLCCFGIPEDIRIRSIHTVVTKPARRVEIVLGRMIGISLIGYLVLLVMATVGYIWIVRQIPTEAQGLLICRVPVYGDGMRFIDREGNQGATGINVGDIWSFRSYIEGATKARAQWLFSNVNESMLDSDGNLNLENSFTAFRSYKGDMTRPLFYDIKIFNPDTNLAYTTDPSPVAEFRSTMNKIPRKLTVDDKQYDLLTDFVTEKKQMFVEVSCIDREQYIGMARPDLFIRMPDRDFWVGYWKAVLGIALTLTLVTMIGVAASTIVKGPIATALTLVIYILSGRNAHQFMDQLVSGQVQGGGVLESIYRLVTQMGPSQELPANPAFKIVQGVDGILNSFLWLCKQVIPRSEYFNMPEFVANGFDVPWATSLLPSLLVTSAFIIPCVVLGYFALRIRELESK
ncbi:MULTISPECIES: ABC transporter permease [unclassified Schlesneria]|uniref:ABC transporter permease n=1 Tax=Schlesneria TaxID=656899 RepID=UPI0035A13276